MENKKKSIQIKNPEKEKSEVLNFKISDQVISIKKPKKIYTEEEVTKIIYKKFGNCRIDIEYPDNNPPKRQVRIRSYNDLLNLVREACAR